MKQYNTKVSREEVGALLAYDPQTGLFTHKVNGHKRKAGAVTGRLDTKGLGRRNNAIRLVFLTLWKKLKKPTPKPKNNSTLLSS
jgi:hypothetical protein